MTPKEIYERRKADIYHVVAEMNRAEVLALTSQIAMETIAPNVQINLVQAAIPDIQAVGAKLGAQEYMYLLAACLHNQVLMNLAPALPTMDLTNKQ
jgi:hypothetical protein